jgi:hypothetical protein
MYAHTDNKFVCNQTVCSKPVLLGFYELWQFQVGKGTSANDLSVAMVSVLQKKLFFFVAHDAVK